MAGSYRRRMRNILAKGRWAQDLDAVAGAPPEAFETQDPALLRRLLRARDRMDAASHEPWPVKRLAEVSGVCETHFAHTFRQAFGIPPHRYLLTRRIEQAATLLRDTELPITQIAFATGWESLGSFGRIFRDITGKSPTEHRIGARAETGQLDRVPACVLKSAQRPDLTIAVSEKRRRAAKGTNRASTKER
ncbi:helix-turn-helix transcriptional regulator [Paucibacter sp. PLA-PC-4]|nr:helix-turn-helix transcriptional regulator [Paucibacter sp. PLA-PC-4]MCX2864861.1 helix-turn-helix transcriptional regulator [Paucibacter sp. PLA-PC-4]